MRIWFRIDCVLLVMAGIQLFFLAEATDRFFAWTIMPPLTAAFLGACYLGSLPLVFLSSREQFWATARLAVFGVLVFTIMMLAATLIHLDRFHLAVSLPFARFAAWVWFLIYILVPPSLIVLIVQQLRVPGVDTPRDAPLPGWLRVALGVQAALLIVLGAALFMFPVATPWPWTLTPLTGRAVAAWLIGIGLIVAHMLWENDYGRIRHGLLSYAVASALQFLALFLFGSAVDWSQPVSVVYLLFLFTTLLVGLVGRLSAKRSVPGKRTVSI